MGCAVMAGMSDGDVEGVITDITITVARMIDANGKSFIRCEFTPGRSFELLALLEIAKHQMLRDDMT